IIGPAFIGYATETSFTPPADTVARPLTSMDAQSVQALRVSCTAQEWEHGGSAFGKVPTFGAFNEDGRLAALAGYKIWSEKIAHLSIVCNPTLRGRGFGRAAVAAATHAAMQHGLLPQYRTLASNTPSKRIASRLGFEEYGYSVFVKL